MMYKKEDVLKANIDLHSALVEKYKETEPHYKEENIRRVSGILDGLQKRTGGASLLDVGCGMGFIIDIAKSVFRSIKGIDITQAMLDKVDTGSETCDISVMIANSDSMPFDDSSFDVCTSYAVLHHLNELLPTFKEIHRVLKDGGVFYSDLDPNFYFWRSMMDLPKDGQYSAIVKREIDAVLHKDRELEEKFDIDSDVLKLAEHLKHEEGGFKEEELYELLSEAGFSKVEIKYEWFLGEGNVIHSRSEETAAELRSYLTEILPLSRHLYKYIMIFAEK